MKYDVDSSVSCHELGCHGHHFDNELKLIQQFESGIFRP